MDHCSYGCAGRQRGEHLSRRQDEQQRPGRIPECFVPGETAMVPELTGSSEERCGLRPTEMAATVEESPPPDMATARFSEFTFSS